MGGWKEVKGANLCDGPCCYGYHEVVEHPPLLGRVVYCKKNSMRAMLLKPTMIEGPDTIIRYIKPFTGKRNDCQCQCHY